MSESILLALIIIVGFYMAWNIGANDVSNAMGTSVGSGALSLRQAIIVAAILEFSGAFFLGSNVSGTIQHGLINIEGIPKDILFYGMLSALLSTALWLQLASFFGWPVSTTHAIVGAMVGFGIVYGGVEEVYWGEIGKIASSWLISPVLSGFFSFILFSILQKKVLYALNPIQASRNFIPWMTGIVFIIFCLSVLLNGLGGFHLDLDPPIVLLIALLLGGVGFIVSKFYVSRKRFEELSQMASPNLLEHIVYLGKAHKHLQRIKLGVEGEAREKVSGVMREIRTLSDKMKQECSFHVKGSDYHVVEKMFAILQLLSACYVAFGHGANDVANAIGPVAVALSYISDSYPASTTPKLLLALGGAGIVIGLATWGWRVMETVGKKITELTPTRGFSAEFGAAITILIASKLGIPISTTHCVVGAVLGVGIARGITALNLRMVREIILSWVITIPSSAAVCILLFYLCKMFLI